MQKLQAYHWIVSGSDFYELHEVFETMYQKGRKDIDDLAERIAAIGCIPLLTLRSYTQTSKIQEARVTKNSKEMMEGILNDLRSLSKQGRKVHSYAMLLSDIPTAHLLADFMLRIGKEEWKVRSWLNKTHIMPSSLDN